MSLPTLGLEDPVPSLDELYEYALKGNTIPVFQKLPADLITPMAAYLKLADPSKQSRQPSFLFESVLGGEKIGRYSFLGTSPRKIIKTGITPETCVDPLKIVEKELSTVRYVHVPGAPIFTGGAVGYISYDCVRYFEPKTNVALEDNLHIPEAVFLMCDSVVVFDHLYSTLQVVSHIRLNDTAPSKLDIEKSYNEALDSIAEIMRALHSDVIPMPIQPPTQPNLPATSNVGEAGYKSFVTNLKKYIVSGDIIQAVPSQRLRKPTALHPLNAYRKLRSLNPSPYMFYLDLIDFQIVGASPEMLVKVENQIVYTHPIAGTRKRGKTPEEDEALANELLSDIKERSEHIMLVDLGRNDVNRVAEPDTVQVDSLMHIERYSHVMHIVSNVSGKLRKDQTRFDAFRSIFPAGTVSGAPKVRAMQLIYELEKEKRGIYAGSVGYFGYSGGLDTCIAIRTMLFKDGHVYLQAGGGIVHDSDPQLEYEETINKLGANVSAIEKAESYFAPSSKH